MPKDSPSALTEWVSAGDFPSRTAAAAGSNRPVTEVLTMVMCDPKQAETLPADVLVKSWMLLDQERENLGGQLDLALRKARLLERKLHQLAANHAKVTGRMEQLSEVVAALHDNLDDLRPGKAG